MTMIRCCWSAHAACPSTGSQSAGESSRAIDRSSAATGELREELGLSVAREALRFELSTPYDFGQGEVRFFTARLPRASELVPNLEEIEERRWFTVSAALELPAFPATQLFLRYLSEQLERRSPSASRSNGNGFHLP